MWRVQEQVVLLQAATSQPSRNRHFQGHEVSVMDSHFIISHVRRTRRRQCCTSQCCNHLQTVLAPVLAVEEDLLWG